MTFEVFSLPNNLKVTSYYMPSFRTISINFIVGVGSRYESVSQEGISHFLEHMAFKGTNSRTAGKIAEEFDEIGGQFNAYTSKEHTVYHAKVLDIHLAKAFDIISDIVLNSLYDEEEIKKEFGVICQEIAQTEDSADDLCYENLVSMAFKDQPLGKSILGTIDSISAFNQESFKSYVDKYYTSSNAILSVAGNFDIQELKKLSRDFFGGITDKKVEKAASSSYGPGYKFVTKELEQTTIFIGYKSCSYLDVTKYYHVQMLSLILGGGFSSRLFQSIREKQGLAYSVGSFNSSYSDNGIFSLYASCGHDKIFQVINSMMDEIYKILDNIS
ncbi:MAG: pitrilysin family protein, partial [Rickettsiaceae bacterium]|nr:pitrilysin family protein [Rickettsiaceae bacterium]